MEPFFHDNFEEYLTNKSTRKVDYALAAELRDIGLQLANSTCQSVMVQNWQFCSHYGLNWVQASLIWQRILPIVVDYYAHKKPKKNIYSMHSGSSKHMILRPMDQVSLSVMRKLYVLGHGSM